MVITIVKLFSSILLIQSFSECFSRSPMNVGGAPEAAFVLFDPSCNSQGPLFA